MISYRYLGQNDSRWCPLAQSVFISALLLDQRKFVVGRMLTRLGLPHNRARLVARQFLEAGVGVVDRGVKGYLVEVDEPQIAWAISERFLQSPVCAVIRTQRVCGRTPNWMRLAGESAVARLTDFQAPAIRTFAIHVWDTALLLSLVSPIGDEVADYDEIELWSTPPARLATFTPSVDPLSLLLSLREANAAHLQMPLRSILRSFWSQSR